MKLLTFLSIITLTQVSAEGFGQVITLHEKNKSIATVLETIEKQSGYFFLYDNLDIREIRPVTIEVTEASVEETLHRLFKEQGVSFKVFNETIVLTKKEQAPLAPVHRTVRQEYRVSGVVKDAETGETLPGVSVVLKNSPTGTSTDLEGGYSLIIPEEDRRGATLVYSFIGYQTQEIPVNDRENIDVQLLKSVSNLDEVVVVGYGTLRKSEVTGAVGMISGTELQKQPGFNALQSLRGKVAGVNIFTNSGAPTGHNRVVIRGVGTINASSDPLYVVDGVAVDNIETMNPNDILSIEVLKDAAATSIYGARGANGVLLISTKRGNSGEGTIVEYTGNISLGTLAKKMDVLNAEEFMEVQRIAYENAPLYANYAPGQEPVLRLDNDRLFDANGNPLYDTDWQEEATRDAISHSHQIGIRSGSKNSSFGAFLNYTDQQGLFLNSYYKRASVKLVYDSKPAEWFSYGINLSINKTWHNNINTEGGSASIPRILVEYAPIFPVKWPDGTWSNSTQTEGTSFSFPGWGASPVHRLLEQDILRAQNRIFGNTHLEFQLSKDLKFRSQFGLNDVISEDKNYGPRDIVGVGYPDGNASINNTKIAYWQIENYFTYIKRSGKHNINAVLGTSWQKNDFFTNGISVRGFPNDFLKYNNLNAASVTNPASSNAYDWSMNSYFSRITYNYNDKYTLTFSGRMDGSSRFGDNNKYGFFPSGGISWLLSNEDFLSGISQLNELRIRTSYGETGNTEIGQYQSLATLGSGTSLIGGSLAPSSYVQRLANPDLEWERTRQFDAGLELSLFDYRLNLELDFYHKLTTNLLLNRPIPSSTGFDNITDNIGSVLNTGFDFAMSTVNIDGERFSWETLLNFNYNKNTIKKLGVNDEDIFPGPDWVSGSQTILRVGESIGSFWGYERLGTYSTEEALELGKYPGEAKRSEEKKIIGVGLPNWSGSLINNFQIGSFDIRVDLQFVLGGEIMQQFLHTTEDRMALTSGLKTQLYDSWTPDNQNTMIQRIRHTQLSGQSTVTDSHWIVDGSYLRGNLLSLGYDFSNADFIRSIGASYFKVNFLVENAFIFHSKEFKGFDPESTSWSDNQNAQNMIYYSYPKPRTYAVSFSIQF